GLRCARLLGRRQQQATHAPRRRVADGSIARDRPPRGTRLARCAQPPAPATSDPARGAARRPQRCAARAWGDRTPGGRDQPVRARLPPTFTARLAVVATGAEPTPRTARKRLRRRFRGARLPRLDVRDPLWAWLGRAVVRRRALRRRLRAA